MDTTQIKNIPTGHTRWRFLLAFALIATAAWLLSLFGYIGKTSAVSFADWTSFITWVFGVYSLSEVGAKGAHAVMNKKG